MIDWMLGEGIRKKEETRMTPRFLAGATEGGGGGLRKKMMGSILNMLTCWYLWANQVEMPGKQLATEMSLCPCEE